MDTIKHAWKKFIVVYILALTKFPLMRSASPHARLLVSGTKVRWSQSSLTYVYLNVQICPSAISQVHHGQEWYPLILQIFKMFVIRNRSRNLCENLLTFLYRLLVANYVTVFLHCGFKEEKMTKYRIIVFSIFLPILLLENYFFSLLKFFPCLNMFIAYTIVKRGISQRNSVPLDIKLIHWLQ